MPRLEDLESKESPPQITSSTSGIGCLDVCTLKKANVETEDACRYSLAPQVRHPPSLEHMVPAPVRVDDYNYQRKKTNLRRYWFVKSINVIKLLVAAEVPVWYSSCLE